MTFNLQAAVDAALAAKDAEIALLQARIAELEGEPAPEPAPNPDETGLSGPVGPQPLASYPGVQIVAPANIQAVVDANPADTTYVLSGTFTSQSVSPKAVAARSLTTNPSGGRFDG